VCIPGPQLVLHGNEAREDAEPFPGVEAGRLRAAGDDTAVTERPKTERT